MSGFSLWELSKALDLKGWSICSEYDLANLRASDLHYLIASPEATAEVCQAAGGVAAPTGNAHCIRRLPSLPVSARCDVVKLLRDPV